MSCHIPIMSCPPVRSRRQRGMVLVASLLLLLVVTIMALSMFRSNGIQEAIAGNLREKQRALHAAETAEVYAEYWLSSGTNAASASVTCSSLLNANLGQGQICSNVLSTILGTVTQPPWQSDGVDIGVSYVPPDLPADLSMDVTTNSGPGTYYQDPRFYISDLGKSEDGTGEIYQIDAAGFGATANTVAVVESTYLVGSEVNNLGGL